MTVQSRWPELDWAQWRETALALQLWTQIVGKVRLALTPWLNHGWQVPLYVTARGLGTSAMPFASGIAELEFDFIGQRLTCCTSAGFSDGFTLEPMTVAVFHRKTMELLDRAGQRVVIAPMPNEVTDPVPFDRDTAPRPYDGKAAHRFWLALVSVDRVFRQFRTGFLGKASPVHFFWGSFDLAVTRFSGRPAPLHPGGVPGLPDPVTREAYSHEVSSAGFWPGSDTYPRAAFYSYAYPEPPGFRDAAMPGPARFDPALGEYLLDYEDVRCAPGPDRLLLDFLESTYAAAADKGGWDRAALDCAPGMPRRPRPLV